MFSIALAKYLILGTSSLYLNRGSMKQPETKNFKSQNNDRFGQNYGLVTDIRYCQFPYEIQ